MSRSMSDIAPSWTRSDPIIPFFSGFDSHNVQPHRNVGSCKLRTFLGNISFISGRDLEFLFFSELQNLVTSYYMSIESVNLSTPVYLKTPSTPGGSFSGGGLESGPASEDLSTTRASP